MRYSSPLFVLALALTALAGLLPRAAQAIPAFARQYEMSCAICHSAVPKLNSFGEEFAGNGFRLPGWKERGQRASYGDDQLALPTTVPLAVRLRGFTQFRQADQATAEENAAQADIQGPYWMKLLGGAPLTEHVSAYFYGILAEKGENGSILVEDAWLSHNDLFGTGIGAQIGQFQASDLMFPREVRLPFQDYLAYRMAGITYGRGVQFSRGVGPLDVSVGVMNGNGIKDERGLVASGYNRMDHSFDNDSHKSVYARIGTGNETLSVGLFGYGGRQPNGYQQTAAGYENSSPDNLPTESSQKRVYGLDLSGQAGRVHWYLQVLHNRWTDFLKNDQGEWDDYAWTGGFAGVDWIASDKWAFSLLYNYADAGDLDDLDMTSGTVSNSDLSGSAVLAPYHYDGINTNLLTLTTSYYMARNVRAMVELNADLQDTNDYAHREPGGYVLVGLDAAF
jgi:hypothetical protein